MRARIPIRNIAGGLWALTAACAGAPEGVVDLGDRAWQVRPGFSIEALDADADAREHRPPIALGAIGGPAGRPAHEYTVAVTFDAAELPAGSRLHGLLVRSVGEAAEVYVNGSKVAGEVRLDASGALAARKVRREWLVPLPRDAVGPGLNRIVFRVAGDAPLLGAVPNFAVGLHHARGYYVGDFGVLQRMSDDWAAIFLVGSYIAFGLFALALALFVGGRPLALLGVFALLLAAYTATRAAFVLEWFSETTSLRRLEFAAQFLASCAFVLFLSGALGRGAAFARLFVAAWAGLAVLAAVAPYPAVLLLVRVWQLTALAGFVGVVFLLAQTLRAGNREVASYVPALAILTVAVTWDILMSLVNLSDVRLAPFGMLLFIGALGINLGARFLRIHRAAEAADAALARTQDRLAGFYNATREAVCLREGNFIIDVNPAFSRLLGYSPEELAGRPFTQLFAADSQDALAAALEHGAARHEAVAVTRDGATFRAELEHRLLAAGGRAHIVTAVRDVTQRKADALKLRERNLELEKLNQRMVDRELRMIELKREIRSLGGSGDAEPGGRGDRA